MQCETYAFAGSDCGSAASYSRTGAGSDRVQTAVVPDGGACGGGPLPPSTCLCPTAKVAALVAVKRLRHWVLPRRRHCSRGVGGGGGGGGCQVVGMRLRSLAVQRRRGSPRPGVSRTGAGVGHFSGGKGDHVEGATDSGKGSLKNGWSRGRKAMSRGRGNLVAGVGRGVAGAGDGRSFSAPAPGSGSRARPVGCGVCAGAGPRRLASPSLSRVQMPGAAAVAGSVCTAAGSRRTGAGSGRC
jgi:hypothetical protein